jgi:hypothetical protein
MLSSHLLKHLMKNYFLLVHDGKLLTAVPSLAMAKILSNVSIMPNRKMHVKFKSCLTAKMNISHVAL